VIDRAVTPTPAAPPSPPLDACRFAVVDVETTGSSPRLGHRVTEIAVAVPGAGGAELAFHTLLDPEMAIPPFIIGLTGISNAMVRGAPRFSGIAAALAEVLAGAVFVAHNARFDWAFLTAEFVRAGVPGPAAPRLCTMRLARRYLPELPRRNLDAVTAHLGVSVVGRHRAAGDALATAAVLAQLLDRARAAGATTLAEVGARW
jgi:DNA polymerase-3 subunit epsilon